MKKIAIIIALFFYTTSLIGQSNNNILLNNKEQIAIKNKVKNSIALFEKNCASIASKKYQEERKIDLINSTLSLFDDHKQRYIEISGIGKNNNNITSRIIRDYLIRLKCLPYLQINITWANVSMTTNLKPSAEMNQKYHTNDWYEGVAVVMQRFDAIVNESIRFRDTTKRIIKVYVRKQNIYIGTDKHTTWVVKLGDIQVGETSSEII